MRKFQSHGSGGFRPEDFAKIGDNVIFEPGVLVFHPDRIEIGSNVYVGHQTILKGYPSGSFRIGDDVWIGPQGFFHSAGNLTIGDRVGIGPGVRALTSNHREVGWSTPILDSPLEFSEIIIDEDSDIGAGAIILPGVHIGRGVQVGAGAVVAGDLPDYCVAVGVPARVIRRRPETA